MRISALLGILLPLAFSLSAGLPCKRERICHEAILNHGEQGYLTPLRMVLLATLIRAVKENGGHSVLASEWIQRFEEFDPAAFKTIAAQARNYSNHLSRLRERGLIERSGSRNRYEYQPTEFGERVFAAHLHVFNTAHLTSSAYPPEAQSGAWKNVVPDQAPFQEILDFSEDQFMVTYVVLTRLNREVSRTATDVWDKLQNDFSQWGLWEVHSNSRNLPNGLNAALTSLVEKEWVSTRREKGPELHYRLTDLAIPCLWRLNAFAMKLLQEVAGSDSVESPR
jgi:DNA-binding PadR family transcriptional regulator